MDFDLTEYFTDKHKRNLALSIPLSDTKIQYRMYNTELMKSTILVNQKKGVYMYLVCFLFLKKTTKKKTKKKTKTNILCVCDVNNLKASFFLEYFFFTYHTILGPHLQGAQTFVCWDSRTDQSWLGDQYNTAGHSVL